MPLNGPNVSLIKYSMQDHKHQNLSQRTKKILYFSVFLTGFTFFIEIFGSIWANSVALFSDAAHVFMDLSALILSVVALHLSERPISDRRTFGLHRLEVFAAFLNGSLVIGMACWIAVESITRFRTLPELKIGPMIGFALFGLAINLLVAWKLHGFSKKDINIRGAFLHVIGDALASVGVLIGGVLIQITGYRVIDPIVGIAVAMIIAVNAVRLLKESIHILLEGVPRHIELDKLIHSLQEITGVEKTNDTHVWSICSHISTLSTHITISSEHMKNQEKIINDINNILKERFMITHSTIQVKSNEWETSVKNGNPQ